MQQQPDLDTLAHEYGQAVYDLLWAEEQERNILAGAGFPVESRHDTVATVRQKLSMLARAVYCAAKAAKVTGAGQVAEDTRTAYLVASEVYYDYYQRCERACLAGWVEAVVRRAAEVCGQPEQAKNGASE